MGNRVYYHNVKDGQIHVGNFFDHWIPELTVTEVIGGTTYTVSGNYNGTESFLKKLERIMVKNISETMEAS